MNQIEIFPRPDKPTLKLFHSHISTEQAAAMAPGPTNITVEKPKFLHDLGFAYLKELRSILCIACKYTILSDRVDGETYLSHYKTLHGHCPQPSKQAQRRFGEELECLSQEHGPILTVNDAQELLDTFPHWPDMKRIPQLSDFENGWVCCFPGCRRAWYPKAKDSTLRKHRHQGVKATMRKATVQRLGRDARKYNFAVNPLLDNADPESGWLPWREKLYADPDIEQKMFPASVNDPDERAATDNFHSKTRWIHHAQEYSISDTISLIAPPSHGDPLLKLTEISRRWIHLPRKTMEGINPIHLRKLLHWKRFACAAASLIFFHKY